MNNNIMENENMIVSSSRPLINQIKPLIYSYFIKHLFLTR